MSATSSCAGRSTAGIKMHSCTISSQVPKSYGLPSSITPTPSTACVARPAGTTACARTAPRRFTACPAAGSAGTGAYSPTAVWTRPSTRTAGSTGRCRSTNSGGQLISTRPRTAPPRTGSGITSAANRKGVAMSDEIITLLKVHEYFRDVHDEALQEVVRQARVIQHAAGSVVHEADVVLTTVNFVLRGRLKAVRIDLRGTE